MHRILNKNLINITSILIFTIFFVLVLIFVFDLRCSAQDNDIQSILIQLEKNEGLKQAEIYVQLEKRIKEIPLQSLMGILKDKKDIKVKIMVLDLVKKKALEGDKKAVEELVNSLTNKDIKGRLRNAIINSLVVIGNDVVPELIKLIVENKNDEFVCNSSIDALSQIKTEYNIRFLVNTLVNNINNEEIKSTISMILTFMGKRVEPFLIPLLQSDDVSVKEEAQYILEIIR